MERTVQFRVLADYEVNEPHPLQLKAGDTVKPLRKDLSWPGWVWVEFGEKDGWVPESFLDDLADAHATSARAFDGSDLSARRGELLTLLEEAPGWIYARRETGETGWFPLFNLKPVRHT